MLEQQLLSYIKGITITADHFRLTAMKQALLTIAGYATTMTTILDDGSHILKFSIS
jgi:hypothetical protein